MNMPSLAFLNTFQFMSSAYCETKERCWGWESSNRLEAEGWGGQGKQFVLETMSSLPLI